MRHLNLLFISIALLSITGLQAQSYQLENVVSYDFGDVNNDLESHVILRNISGSTKRVLVKSEALDLVAGSSIFFCWDQCYSSAVTVSPTYIEVADGGTIENFHGYVRPYGFAGISVVRFTFYTVNAPEDSVQLISYFEASPVGIKDIKVNEVSVEAYPNPADDKLNITYTRTGFSGQATIELFNMLGAKVYTVNVNGMEGSLSIPTSDLKAGLYFYSIREEGKNSRPQRLTIKH
jgi:hypothetical protein